MQDRSLGEHTGHPPNSDVTECFLEGDWKLQLSISLNIFSKPPVIFPGTPVKGQGAGERKEDMFLVLV